MSTANTIRDYPLITKHRRGSKEGAIKNRKLDMKKSSVMYQLEKEFDINQDWIKDLGNALKKVKDYSPGSIKKNGDRSHIRTLAFELLYLEVSG